MENKKLKKAAGVLSTFFISIVIFALAFTTMFLFYGAIIDEDDGYGYLTFETSSDFNTLNSAVDEMYNGTKTKSVEMRQKFESSESTGISGEDNMITNAFGVVKDLFKNSFKLVFGTAATIQKTLHIDEMWYWGFMTIVIVVLFITVLSGFLKSTNW